MDGRAKGRKNRKQPNKTMKEAEQWQQHRAFGALDRASEKHSVIVVDQAGKVIEQFEIEHSAFGWKKFREKLQPYDSIPFAIETGQGAAVEQLLEAGMIVYPLNPKSAQAYRERKAPSGAKDECYAFPVVVRLGAARAKISALQLVAPFRVASPCAGFEPFVPQVLENAGNITGPGGTR
jgi:transposase